MDYDSTSIPQKYHATRQLPDRAMRQWLAAIHKAAPLQPGSIIADVGCGTGRFSAGLAETYHARVIGLDRSVGMLAEARTRNRQPWFCVGDASALPLARESLDMIFLSNVIHHVADLQRAAEGFALALERGGFAVVRNYLRELLSQVPYLEFFPEATTVSIDILHSRMEIQRAFERAGFQLTSFQTLEQPVADSPVRYLDKIRARVYSDLAAIPDEAFGAGVARMAAAVSAGWHRSLSEPIALFSFQLICAHDAEQGARAKRMRNAPRP